MSAQRCTHACMHERGIVQLDACRLIKGAVLCFKVITAITKIMIDTIAQLFCVGLSVFAYGCSSFCPAADACTAPAPA